MNCTKLYYPQIIIVHFPPVHHWLSRYSNKKPLTYPKSWFRIVEIGFPNEYAASASAVTVDGPFAPDVDELIVESSRLLDETLEVDDGVVYDDDCSSAGAPESFSALLLFLQIEKSEAESLFKELNITTLGGVLRIHSTIPTQTNYIHLIGTFICINMYSLTQKN